MTQQPDKFFRDKLHGYEKPVSPEVWKRVSVNAQARNNRLWLRVAAAVLLLATSTLLIYPVIVNDGKDLVAEKSDQPKQEPSVVIPVPDSSRVDARDKASIHPQSRVKSSVPQTTTKQERVAPGKSKKPLKEPSKIQGRETHAPVATVTPAESVTEGVLQETKVKVADTNTVANGPGAKKMTIVFTAQEVNDRYLEKNAVADATPDDKEASGLKKLLDKAYDLKHNQDPLGGLRQKKNEILAMNFRNDKRTQND